MSSLLEEFVDEECVDSIRSMLITDIEALDKDEVMQLKEYTFNRFNVYLNFTDKEVRIEDELDVDESGVLVLGLDEFLSVLKKN